MCRFLPYLSLVVSGVKRNAVPTVTRPAGTASMNSFQSGSGMVAFFSMFRQVQAGGFDLFAGTETDDGLDNVSNDDGTHDGQHQRDADGFDLREPLRAVSNRVGQAILGGGVGCIHF